MNKTENIEGQDVDRESGAITEAYKSAQKEQEHFISFSFFGGWQTVLKFMLPTTTTN